IFLELLRPCRVPSPNWSCFATASGSSCALAGRFHSTQCPQVPAGASGSSMISAKLTVRAGASLHSSAGEKSASSQVCFFGITAPGANAELFSTSDIDERPPAEGCDCEASVLPPTVPSRSASVASFATECFRSTGAEKLLAEVIGIIVREATQYQNSRLHEERCAQQCAKDDGLSQLAEAELVHIERAMTPDEPQGPAKQYGHESQRHDAREESESAGGEDYADEPHLA